MKAMEKLVSDNLIRFIGVSNFNLKELQEAEQALQNERIACNQVLYNLEYRAIEKRIAPILYKEGNNCGRILTIWTWEFLFSTKYQRGKYL